MKDPWESKGAGSRRKGGLWSRSHHMGAPLHPGRRAGGLHGFQCLHNIMNSGLVCPSESGRRVSYPVPRARCSGEDIHPPGMGQKTHWVRAKFRLELIFLLLFLTCSQAVARCERLSLTAGARGACGECDGVVNHSASRSGPAPPPPSVHNGALGTPPFLGFVPDRRSRAGEPSPAPPRQRIRHQRVGATSRCLAYDGVRGRTPANLLAVISHPREDLTRRPINVPLGDR